MVESVASPLEVAIEWIAAFEAGDVEAFQALMHPDAMGNCLNCAYDRQETAYFSQIGEGTADVSDSRLLALANGSLNATCTMDGPVVACETVRSSDFGHVTADGEPTRQWVATYEFTVESGLITRRILISHEGVSFDFGIVADYERWLREHHPDVHSETFAFGTILLTTVGQFEIHQEFVPQFWATR